MKKIIKDINLFDIRRLKQNKCMSTRAFNMYRKAISSGYMSGKFKVINGQIINKDQIDKSIVFESFSYAYNKAKSSDNPLEAFCNSLILSLSRILET
jgi:hypothetical protein